MGLTQAMLAEMTGYSVRAVSRFEGGLVAADDAWRSYWARCFGAVAGLPVPWSTRMVLEPLPGLTVVLKR